ncbi:MAG TPA: NAD(P)-binding domain-containing protein [Holophaga sp.]|nr:NAD(P)-binding domain-containing protein [Holophaga sp.]
MVEQGTLRLGFIGTGNIASAVVEGFCTSGASCSILVSPRNERKSRALEGRFPQVRRAGSNQEALDGSDLVVLALRPAVAREELTSLRFREDHTVLSLIPVIPRQDLAALVQPAARVFKVLPLPYSARRMGLVPFHPADPQVEACLRCLGEPMPVRDERELHLLWAVTGLISPFYAQMEAVQRWCVAGGADPEGAKRYVASMYACLAGLAENSPGQGFKALAQEAATPGGLNEMALRMVQEGTAFPDLRRALDAVLERFGEAPVPPA